MAAATWIRRSRDEEVSKTRKLAGLPSRRRCRFYLLIVSCVNRRLIAVISGCQVFFALLLACSGNEHKRDCLVLSDNGLFRCSDKNCQQPTMFVRERYRGRWLLLLRFLVRAEPQRVLFCLLPNVEAIAL